MARYKIRKERRWNNFHEAWLIGYSVIMEFYNKPTLKDAIRAKCRLIQMDKERKNNG